MSDSNSEPDYNPFNAIVNGNPYDIIDWICDGKVDVDVCDEDHGESLLIWSARHSIYELLEFLVKKGCDINHIAHSDGNTALDICKNPKMKEFLIQHGAKSSEELE